MHVVQDLDRRHTSIPVRGAGLTPHSLQQDSAMREVVGMFSRPSVTVQSSCGDSCSSLHLPDAAKFEPPLRRVHGAGTVVTSAPALHVPAAVGTASASASSTCQASFRIELTQLPMEPSRTLVSSRMLALVLYCWSLHKAFFW